MTAPAQMIGLFEGYGGLSMAVTNVTGAELVAYSELDPAASKLLAHHNPGVPNLGDITAVDWSAVHVDTDRRLILTGGFPCQDVSAAGRRAGLRPGTRSGLWSHMAYAVDQLRPDLVVIENVRGLLSADAACDLEPCPWCVGDDEGRPLRALGAVLGDLADLGYDARWVGLRAADVGAPHGRFRVFVLACPADAARQPGRRSDGERELACGPQAGRIVAANPTRIGRDEGRAEPARLVGRPDAAVGGARAAADAGRDGREGDTERHVGAEGGESSPFGGDPSGRVLEWGDYRPAIERWELILGRPAPAPTQIGARGGRQLSPLFVEWLMGLPIGHVTDPAIGLTRNEQLARLGNGVVWQQAAAALRHMFSAMTLERAA